MGRQCKVSRRAERRQNGASAFIKLYGIVAFLAGAAIAAVALLIAIVQVWCALRRKELMQFLPPALGATAAAFMSGVYLVCAAEFRWVDGELLDTLSGPVALAAAWWVFHNRMSSGRNRPPGR